MSNINEDKQSKLCYDPGDILWAFAVGPLQHGMKVCYATYDRFQINKGDLFTFWWYQNRYQIDTIVGEAFSSLVQVVQQDQICSFHRPLFGPAPAPQRNKNSSYHKRKEIFICNTRANPCAPFSVPLKLFFGQFWLCKTVRRTTL